MNKLLSLCIGITLGILLTGFLFIAIIEGGHIYKFKFERLEGKIAELKKTIERKSKQLENRQDEINMLEVMRIQINQLGEEILK